MLRVSLAFSWLIWRQHRWALLALLTYMIGAVTASALAPASSGRLLAEWMVAIAIAGLYVQFLYAILVFSFGFGGMDLLARESCFAPSLFRLPVATGPLVFWPTLVGAAAIGLVWLINASMILPPWIARLDDNLTLPVWWPTFLAMATLAWLQAFLWSPYGWRGMRLVLVSMLLPTVGLMAGLTANGRIAEPVLMIVCAGSTLLAWGIAYRGALRGRHGDVPSWDGLRLRPRLARPGPFASLAQAQTWFETQVWFEWRLGGWTLAAFTFALLLVVLVPLRFGKNDVIPTQQTLLSALAVPVFLAGTFGARGASNSARDGIGLGAFCATLPIATAELIAAMLKVALRNTIAAWGVVAVMMPLAVLVTGHGSEVAGWWHTAVQEHHPAGVVMGMLAMVGLLVVWTWKRQVDKLYFGLAGRQGLASVIAVAWFPATITLFSVPIWVYRHPETQDAVFAILPWLLGLLITIRLGVSIWALHQVLRRGLVQPKTVACWLAGWLVVAAFLAGILMGTVPGEYVPVRYVVFAVLFVMPMARLAASPLALAWNRHR